MGRIYDTAHRRYQRLNDEVFVYALAQRISLGETHRHVDKLDRAIRKRRRMDVWIDLLPGSPNRRRRRGPFDAEELKARMLSFVETRLLAAVDAIVFGDAGGR